MPRRSPSLSPVSLRTAGKLAFVLGAVVLVAAFAVSTGAFTAVDASRPASVGVSKHDALVGYHAADTVVVGQRSDLLTITNRVQEPVTVTVSLADGRDGTLFAGWQMRRETISVSLAPGESQTVRLRANRRTGQIAYGVDVSGNGVSVSFGQQTVRVVTPGHCNRGGHWWDYWVHGGHDGGHHCDVNRGSRGFRNGSSGYWNGSAGGYGGTGGGGYGSSGDGGSGS